MRVVVFRAMKSWALAALMCSISLSVWAAPPFGTDLSGHLIEQIVPAGSRAVVLFFAASDCPIANRYIPEIERLDGEFSKDGVRFLWVYPNPGDTADVVRRHDRQFDIHADTVLDSQQRLTRMAHATVTPEVAVFVPAGKRLREVYKGRIDDRYLAIGQERPHAMRHDLEDAIRAVLSNHPVPRPGGPAVGCAIVPLNTP
ncbi:MAG TPA: redoxin domain-containing protein [Terracidiphilus sp.]|nr:redoxin domain-containing protein [Terracidiphilus sp.]